MNAVCDVHMCSWDMKQLCMVCHEHTHSSLLHWHAITSRADLAFWYYLNPTLPQIEASYDPYKYPKSV